MYKILYVRAAHCLMMKKGIDKRKEEDLIKGRLACAFKVFIFCIVIVKITFDSLFAMAYILAHYLTNVSWINNNCCVCVFSLQRC